MTHFGGRNEGSHVQSNYINTFIIGLNDTYNYTKKYVCKGLETIGMIEMGLGVFTIFGIRDLFGIRVRRLQSCVSSIIFKVYIYVYTLHQTTRVSRITCGSSNRTRTVSESTS